MKIKIDNYKRKALFEQYDSYTNPFASITTKLDITNIYNLCKGSGHFYATMGYYLSKAMNDIEDSKLPMKTESSTFLIRLRRAIPISVRMRR